MFRLVPPAGIPVSLSDIGKIIGARLLSDKAKPDFAEKIKEIAGAKYCWLINSGRAANFIILKSLREISDGAKKEIVIPAYTCFSVPASIVKAGLKIRTVDVDPKTLDYNYEKLNQTDLSNSLALLPANLFGVVSDWNRLRRAIKGKSIYAIDDSAQTLGLSCEGIKCGSLGDIGFFSFGRGKNLTTYSGGAIVTNDKEIAGRVEKNILELNPPGITAELRILFEFIFYAIMMRPWLYWIPDRLPFLGLGKTIYDEGFSTQSLTGTQKVIGPIIYARFPGIIKTRYENSNALASGILALHNYTVPGWRAGANIPYIRLPILADSEHVRDQAIVRLRRKGIGASAMYPSPINEIPMIKKHLVNPEDDFSGAGNVSRCLLTLPTHEYLTKTDINNVLVCLKEINP